MQKLIESISSLYKTWCGKAPESIDVIPQSGSDRRYFRLHDGRGKSVIATIGANIPENETFMYFSETFYAKGLPVPQVLAVNEDKTIYLQEDFGDTSLLNVLETKGYTSETY